MSYGVVLYEGKFMVKAVSTEDANRISSTDSISIENPEDDVEFKIDFEEDKAGELPAVSKNAIGGTELMRNWLYDHMEKRESGLLDNFQIISTRVRELEEDKKRILWVHDLANDPEVQHLKEEVSLNRFERVVFVSHWQQY